MNIMIWILAGGVVGWIACTALHLNVARGSMVSAAIGIAGAFFGGYVVAPIFGAPVGEAGAFSPFGLLVAVASAIGCLSLSDMAYERFGI